MDLRGLKPLTDRNLTSRFSAKTYHFSVSKLRVSALAGAAALPSRWPDPERDMTGTDSLWHCVVINDDRDATDAPNLALPPT